MEKNVIKESWNLKTVCEKKSYYGNYSKVNPRTSVICKEDGTEFLRSYNTIVACKDNSGRVVKLWDGYSATTMKHLNEFGFNGGKKAWESTEKQCGFDKRVFFDIDGKEYKGWYEY